MVHSSTGRHAWHMGKADSRDGGDAQVPRRRYVCEVRSRAPRERACRRPRGQSGCGHRGNLTFYPQHGRRRPAAQVCHLGQRREAPQATQGQDLGSRAEADTGCRGHQRLGIALLVRKVTDLEDSEGQSEGIASNSQAHRLHEAYDGTEAADVEIEGLRTGTVWS